MNKCTLFNAVLKYLKYLSFGGKDCFSLCHIIVGLEKNNSMKKLLLGDCHSSVAEQKKTLWSPGGQ